MTVLLIWLCAVGLGAAATGQVASDVSAHREAAIAELVAVLETEEVFADRPEEAEQAILALGQLRAEAAVPVLVEHLLFSPHPRDEAQALTDYPCAVALCRIGSPAAPVLLKRLAGDDEAVWLGTQVLLYIDGPAIAQARLHLAAGAQLREDRTQRLRRALGELDAAVIPSLGYGPTDVDPPPAHPAAIAREAAIHELLAFLATEGVFTAEPDRAEEAVVALGHLRAEAAIPLLVRNLMFEPHPPFGADGLCDFPCAVALIRIGAQAAPALLQVMPTDDDLSWLGYHALAHIDGPQLASVRLGLAAESVTDERPGRRGSGRRPKTRSPAAGIRWSPGSGSRAGDVPLGEGPPETPRWPPAASPAVRPRLPQAGPTGSPAHRSPSATCPAPPRSCGCRPLRPGR